jgi:flagellar assembly protein FliH
MQRGNPRQAVRELVLPVPSQLRDVVLADPSVPLVRVPEPPPQPPPDRHLVEEQEAIQRVLAHLTELAGELQAQQRQRLEEMQQVAVELAVAVASRLVHERIEAGAYAVDALVRQAVEQLQATGPISIYLNPQDLELLEKRLRARSGPVLDAAKVRLLADAALARGDCRADAGESSVEFQIQQQLAEIRRHLLEVLPDATLERRRPLPADRPLRRFPDRRHTA